MSPELADAIGRARAWLDGAVDVEHIPAEHRAAYLLSWGRAEVELLLDIVTRELGQ